MSVCTDCARGPRKGCCWADPETRYENTFGISVADVRRIVKATGKPPSEFLFAEEIEPELREQIAMGYRDLDRVMKGNLRLALRSKPDGSCTLLGPQGCTLSREDRPRVCATYPAFFEKMSQGRAVVKSDALADDTVCLALERAGGSESKLYRILSSSPSDTRKLVEKAHQEAIEHDRMSMSEIREALDELEDSA